MEGWVSPASTPGDNPGFGPAPAVGGAGNHQRIVARWVTTLITSLTSSRHHGGRGGGGGELTWMSIRYNMTIGGELIWVLP